MKSETNSLIKGGLIAPTNLLQKCCIAKLQLCYATIALQDSEYASFYKERSDEGDTVILDGSPDLPRRPISPEYLVEIAKLVRPSIVILPDQDFSTNKTLEASLDFKRFFSKDIQDVEYIGMLQGASLEQLRVCKTTLKTKCDYFGMSCALEKITNRNVLVRELRIIKKTFLIEVYSDALTEIPEHSSVIGVITSLPVRLALEDRYLDQCFPTPKQLDFSSLEEPDMDILSSNIDIYLDQFEGSL